jgi:hypothetical protein
MTPADWVEALLLAQIILVPGALFLWLVLGRGIALMWWTASMALNVVILAAIQ